MPLPLLRKTASRIHSKTYQNQLKEHGLVDLDEVIVEGLDLLFSLARLAVLALLVGLNVELAELNHFCKDLGGHVGKRHGGIVISLCSEYFKVRS